MTKGIKFLVASLVLLIPLLLAGCSDRWDGSPKTVVVFADVHFNPFYDPSLFTALNAADAGQWASVFETSTVTAPSTWGNDTNYPLFKLALASIKQNRGNSPFIIFAGDILGHYLPKQFYQQINGTTNPRDAADVAAMKVFIGKTVAFFTQQVREAAGEVPVLFAIGNADSYTGLGPDSGFLADTAELYYTQFVSGAVDHQTFIDSFTSGGYYAAEPAGTNLTVIELNTFEFSPYFNGSTASAVTAELAWLDTALASARIRGKKVWLLMHVPPGADKYSTAQTVDAGGHITNAVMMWDETYLSSFLQILAKYPDLITQTLVAHTHMDEYRIISSDNVAVTTPGIAPYFGNNPAYKIFTFSIQTSKTTDYSSHNYDLATMPEQFAGYYTFSAVYPMRGYLNDSLSQLYPLLSTYNSLQQLYREFYFSGHNYSTPSGTMLYPITDTTWPVYWCGIGHLDQQGVIDCVNSY
ncbi:MAG: hypothetical protein PHY31_03215 [Smithellaceae bacterium]|nr:hypothetical protein [Smithellaceae bacterium]